MQKLAGSPHCAVPVASLAAEGGPRYGDRQPRRPGQPPRQHKGIASHPSAGCWQRGLRPAPRGESPSRAQVQGLFRQRLPFVPIPPAFWFSLLKYSRGKGRNANRASSYQGGPCTWEPAFPCPAARLSPGDEVPRATGQPRVLLLGWKLKAGRIFAFGVAILRFSPRRRGSGLLSAPRAPAVSAARKPVSLFPAMCCSWREPHIAMVLYSLSNYSICVDVQYNSHPTLIILS